MNHNQNKSPLISSAGTSLGEFSPGFCSFHLQGNSPCISSTLGVWGRSLLLPACLPAYLSVCLPVPFVFSCQSSILRVHRDFMKFPFLQNGSATVFDGNNITAVCNNYIERQIWNFSGGKSCSEKWKWRPPSVQIFSCHVHSAAH